MKLWLLRPVEGLSREDDPWIPWYDKVFGFVVRTESEKSARRLADFDACDENSETINPWLDSRYSTCQELSAEGEPGIIIQDFAAA